MAVTNPHFDLPFRFQGPTAAVVEQDTLDDIGNCVEAILVCPVGFRPETTSFGSPDFALRAQPVGKDLVTQIILDQEPRAAVVVTEHPDRFDELIDRINIELTTRGGGE